MRTRTIGGLVALLTLLGLCRGLCAQPASPAAMRQRIADLEDEVATLRQRLADLQAERDTIAFELRQLRDAVVPDRQGAPGSQPGEGVQPDQGPAGRSTAAGRGWSEDRSAGLPVSALSQEPLASPDAMFIALLLDYRERVLDESAAGGQPTEEAVEAWVQSAIERFEGPAAWTVRIDGLAWADEDGDPDARRVPLRARAVVLDPATAMPISRPSTLEIPRRFASRFPESLAPGESLYADLRVKVAAAPIFQPGRDVEGPFNYPPFLGPYAGFGQTVDLIGMKFVELAEIRARITPAKSPSDR